MKNTIYCSIAISTGFFLGLATPQALAEDSPSRGVVQLNDGSFNYQGYLEENGQPANGMYSFRFDAFQDAVGSNVLHELYFISPTVPVVDGLFNVNVQMGGTPTEAKRFWREVGNREMYLEIGVAQIEGGPYTTLGSRTKVGWSARAQYSGISDALHFPYIDTYSNDFTDQDTMLSLTHQFGGTVLELIAGAAEEPPILSVLSPKPSGLDFGLENGAIQVDALGRLVGVLSIADEFPIVGIINSDTGNQNSAILGQVNSSVPGANALQALNLNSNNYAYLGTPTHAGEFFGDVNITNNLRVQGEPVRDFAFNDPSPIGPIAYGFVSSNGSVSGATANLSAVWDAANSQYLITVAGESIVIGLYSAVVTVVDSIEPRLATTNTSNGNLLVKVWDLNSGNIAIQDNFQVVIYKPNPNAFLLQSTPDGVDPDKYYEQTGTAPAIGTTPQTDPQPTPTPRGIGD
ncbi:MAG: hypothetical protein ACWA5W_10015 [Phycisphaerales bacterium]